MAKIKYDKAFKNYLIVANLGDGWELNKVGEYYTIKMKKRIEEKLQSLYIPNIDIEKYLYKK